MRAVPLFYKLFKSMIGKETFHVSCDSFLIHIQMLKKKDFALNTISRRMSCLSHWLVKMYLFAVFLWEDPWASPSAVSSCTYINFVSCLPGKDFSSIKLSLRRAASWQVQISGKRRSFLCIWCCITWKNSEMSPMRDVNQHCNKLFSKLPKILLHQLSLCGVLS